MKVLFVVPTTGPLTIRRNLEPVGSKIFRVPFLGVLLAASCVPRKHQVTLIDEHVEQVDYDFDCDLVGITVATPTAKRAYAMAKEFRRRGKKVFVGGFHPSFSAEECLQHVDSVVIGEAEGNVQRLIADFEVGALRKVYRRDGFCDPAEIPSARMDLVRHPKQYFTTQVIHSSRGCPFKCSFCGVRLFFGDTYRRRPTVAVIEELAAFPGRKVLFTDDNMIGEPAAAKDLFRRMIPLKKWWMGQMSINCVHDPELLDLAARSGCLGVFIGFETVNMATIASCDKHQNRAVDYRAAIGTLHRHGIGVAAGTMFGFEEDDPSVFLTTLNFFLDAKLDVIQVDPVTPFPGTPLYRQLQSESRLITSDWDRFNIAEAVFHPRKMSADDLNRGVEAVRRGFYTRSNVLKRFFRAWRYRSLPAALVIGLINFGYWKHLRDSIGYPP